MSSPGRYMGTKEGQEALRERMEALDDWHGKCRRCGEKLYGTLKQLREHVCDGEHS